MKKYSIKRIGNNILFAILLTVASGYIPSGLSIGFLILAVLICPVTVVKEWVDQLLDAYTVRSLWIVLIIAIMGCYPATEFAIIGQRIASIANVLSRYFSELVQ